MHENAPVQRIAFGASGSGPSRFLSAVTDTVIGLTVVGVVSLRYAISQSQLPIAPPWSRDDGPYWIVAAVNWLNGRGLTNSLTRFSTFDHMEFGANSILGYPPVHSLMLVTISPTPSVEGVHFAIWVIEALALALIGFSAALLVRRSEPEQRPLLTGVAVLGIACIGALQFSGRPESTFWLILSLGCAYWSYGNRLHPILVGSLLGLLGATQSLAALMVAMVVAMLISFRCGGKEALLEISCVGTVAIITFLIAVSTYYGLGNFVSHMISATPEQGFWYISGQALLDANVLDYLRPFSSMLFVMALLGLAVSIRVHTIRSKLLFSAALATLTLTGFFAFGIRPHCTYNLHALAPIALMMVLVSCRYSKRWAWFMVAVLLVPAVGLPIQAGVLIDHRQGGHTIERARTQFEKVVRAVPDGTPFLVDETLWPLSSNGQEWENWAIIGSGRMTGSGARNALVVVQEVRPYFPNSRLEDGPAPRVRDDKLGIDHVLWLDCFTRRPVSLFGRRIYYPTLGFSFAVYVPADIQIADGSLFVEGCVNVRL